MLSEGRNRQIRRVAQKLGYRVKQLHRTAIGSITLHKGKDVELPQGKYRHLTKTEINFLYDSFNSKHSNFKAAARFRERSVMNKNNLTIEQQQKLKDLGANLNQIRLAKNISLDTIAANTRISKRLLEAIEAGNFEELPEPFYIKALVSKFCQADWSRGNLL